MGLHKAFACWLAPAGCQTDAGAADAMCEASSSSDADSEHSTSSGYESDASIGEIIDEFGAGLSLQQKFPVQGRDVPPSPRGRSGHVWRTSSLLHVPAARASRATKQQCSEMGSTGQLVLQYLWWFRINLTPLLLLVAD